VPLTVSVVGVTSDASLAPGVAALAPYNLMTLQWTSFTSITLIADSDAAVDTLRQRVQALGFEAQSTGDQLRALGELLGRLRLALLGLSLVALLLACLGIANTMYTAVLERTREIGILKAVGARSRDVMLLFMAEAAVIGVVGGILGAGVAAELASLGNSMVDRMVPTVSGVAAEVFRPDLVLTLAALALAVVLSIGSGWLPAMRAAAQEPMKALHHE
jgi:putative ABC transport system permease protein